jgi:hypothetical protein
MFWLRYETAEGVLETALNPAPMFVEYPPRRLFKERVTQDGAVVVQRPLRDHRPRRWIWQGYGPAHEPFATQWQLLETLEYRARLEAGLPGTVEIWEDVSGIGGFDRTDAPGGRIYTKVKILQTNREPRREGGPVVYESTVEFRIEDMSYKAF